jgi:hypothetical protein
VHPARFDAEPIVDPGSNAKLGLEQDSAAEVDLVVRKILEILGRSGVSGVCPMPPLR